MKRLGVIILLLLLWLAGVSVVMQWHYANYRTMEFRGHRLTLDSVSEGGVLLTDEGGEEMYLTGVLSLNSGKNTLLTIRYRGDITTMYRYSIPAGPSEQMITFSDGSTLPATGDIDIQIRNITDNMYRGLQREEMLLFRDLLNYHDRGLWPNVNKWMPIYIAGAVLLPLAVLAVWAWRRRKSAAATGD